MADTPPASDRRSHHQPVSKSRPGPAASSSSLASNSSARRGLPRLLSIISLLLAAGFILFHGIAFFTHANAPAHGVGSRVNLEIGILVFREGLECMLVLAAIMAGMAGGRDSHRRPIALGAGAGFVATLATWAVAVRIMDGLSLSVSALALQAATGLLAVVVLLVVMNWFFHKIYWTGWISMHNRRKRDLMEGADLRQTSRRGIFYGMAALGFTSLYREGFEIVLFLQTYRLRYGGETVASGVGLGLFLTGIIVVLTFMAQRRLPYRKMLVLTGALLGVVLLVMVGEQAQEMQLAHWIATTNLPALAGVIPVWMGMWFSVFPTLETLLAQAAAAILVLGSYVVAGRRVSSRNHAREESPRGSASLEAQTLASRSEVAG